MESRRLATMVRRLGDTRTRRGTLAGALLALTVPAVALRGGEVQARKKRKKNKNLRKCPPTQNPQLSCQDACGENCGSCIHRKVDSILCGNGFSAGLQACSSDSDCVGVKFDQIEFPYCATQIESRANGVINTIGNGNGVCTNVLACSAV